MIELHQVRRTYVKPGGKGRILALKINELKVEKGGILIVQGPNGSGKTTLLHIISGLLSPDSGYVIVDGQDLSRLSEAEKDRFRAMHIGYLLQGAPLMEPLSAVENVMLPMLFSERRTGRSRIRKEAMQLLTKFGVEHRADHTIPAMSGGERQRVALAVAIANDPPVLLVDEPFTGLDTASAAGFAQDLCSLAVDGKKALIVVTHEDELLGSGVEKLNLTKSDQNGDVRQ